MGQRSLHRFLWLQWLGFDCINSELCWMVITEILCSPDVTRHFQGLRIWKFICGHIQARSHIFASILAVQKHLAIRQIEQSIKEHTRIRNHMLAKFLAVQSDTQIQVLWESTLSNMLMERCLRQTQMESPNRNPEETGLPRGTFWVPEWHDHCLSSPTLTSIRQESDRRR